MSNHRPVSAEDDPPAFDPALIERLTIAMEELARTVSSVDSGLKCYTPEEAAPLLGKSTNWVVEAIQGRRIPFTYVGRSPRLTAAHIRWVLESGEVKPSKYAHWRAA